MYPGISSFIEYVGEALADVAPKTNYPMTRRLRTFKKFDFVAGDSDDYHRIDIAMTLHTNSSTEVESDYKNAISIVEVKRYISEQEQAYEQMLEYSRNLFGTQPNRRFAWGLTVCGTMVRACIIVNDKVLLSPAMNVSTSDGRRAFVTLLTDWSMCESKHLGYDPTIRYNDSNQRWEIDVYDSEKRVARTYICESRIYNAYSIFGRRTRCFVAHEKPADLVSASDHNLPKVLIKDSWAHMDSPDSNVARDEVAYLREIQDALAKDSTLNGTYPHLEAGGVVKIKCSDGVVDDTTQSILMKIDSIMWANVPVRIHRRIVMSPVVEPLQKVKSMDELIVIVGDVMAAHTAIAKRCGLLHRDLSVNNIMFHRDKDGVRGMLIDFDNARRITNMEKTEQPDCVGTLPFMSIGNLELSD
ncbi:hypothetical protein GGH12_006216, partial [Coemansia sp. RSA 1822]